MSYVPLLPRSTHPVISPRQPARPRGRRQSHLDASGPDSVVQATDAASKPSIGSGQVQPAGPDPSQTAQEFLTEGDALIPEESLPFRAQMESSFGRDFGAVRVRTGAVESMRGLGAQAATRGRDIVFAENHPSAWLVAHEAAHVVQQARSGRSDPARGATVVSAPDSEAEADRVANRVTAGEPAGQISSRAIGIHLFSPSHHKEVTVAGLSKSFSAQEIGEIYAANWERDFSQVHPIIANAVIAWVAVKDYYLQKGGNVDGDVMFVDLAEIFKRRIKAVIDADMMDLASGTSLGGTTEFEHMDAPDEGMQRDADQRWQGMKDGLAGYILDSKTYIKDQMFAAVDVYRRLNKIDPLDRGTGEKPPEGNLWGLSEPPSNYRATAVTDDGKYVTTKFHEGYDDAQVLTRSPVVNNAAAEAKTAGARSDPSHDPKRWYPVAQHLGRAMHAFEDFWAHSNWIELAKQSYLTYWAGDSAPAVLKDNRVTNKDLRTGNFKADSKIHALGHKLLTLATGLLDDKTLLLKVFNRRQESDKIDSPAAMVKPISEKTGTPGPSDNDIAYTNLRQRGLLAVHNTFASVQALVKERGYGIEDFLTNSGWLTELKTKGQQLIKDFDICRPDTHCAISKDQEEPGKHFKGAKMLAKIANQETFGPLRDIMDKKDPLIAIFLLQGQMRMVDRMIQAPSPKHPLWPFVKEAILAD